MSDDGGNGFQLMLFGTKPEDVAQINTLKQVSGVHCPQCGSTNLGLQDETLLFCRQCHAEVKDHALNAMMDFDAKQPIMTR